MATYGSEFVDAIIAMDQIIDIHTNLPYLGVKVNKPYYLFGDNHSVITSLTIPHPSLNKCCQFQPSDTLLGMIWDILQHKDSPDPLIVRELRPLALGSIISSGL